jgi:putative hemolysin
VGGLALALLGRVPEEGDTLELPGATLTVTGTEGRVVTRVEVRFHNVVQPEPDHDQ